MTAIATQAPTQLCLECGLCCNGVIFADGQLQPADDVVRLEAAGLKLLGRRRAGVAGSKFRQPCAAFVDGQCAVYTGRPTYCREFECRLLQHTAAGRLNEERAREIIRAAQQRAERVRRLLRQLGEGREHLPLSRRFKAVRRRLESRKLDNETAERFGQLTLAVHDLNVLLSEAFYPRPRPGYSHSKAAA